MKEEQVKFDRVDLSDRLLHWATDIDMCFRALNILEERMDDSPNEHCLLLLVKGKLNEVQHQINIFDTENL